MSNEDVVKFPEELKWVQVREEANSSFYEKIKAKGILGFLVPAGCIVTSGVLFRGLHHMVKRDSRSQQQMMRYRVGAQGVTIVLAMISILLIPLTKSN